MSKESAREFITKYNNDPDFRSHFEQVKESERFNSLAREHGFDCTLQEVKSVSSELSDEDLDNVSGGVHWQTL
jgi:predicted ribosomally synthesized peptide with nif11-like leader